MADRLELAGSGDRDPGGREHPGCRLPADVRIRLRPDGRDPVPEDNARIQAILDAHAEPGRIEFHAVRTRESGARQFMEMHMLVPGDWTVLRGHDAMEDLVEKIVAEFPAMRVTGHLEPVSDPRSYEDMAL